MHTIKGKLYKTITLTCTTAHFLCSRKRDKITIIIHAYRSFHKKLGEPVNMCVRWHAGSQWHHLICRTTWSTRHASQPSGAVAVTTAAGDGWNCLRILCGPTLSLHGFDDEPYGYHSWNIHSHLTLKLFSKKSNKSSRVSNLRDINVGKLWATTSGVAGGRCSGVCGGRVCCGHASVGVLRQRHQMMRILHVGRIYISWICINRTNRIMCHDHY